MIPKAFSGRWGSVDGVEARLLKATPQLVVPVLNEVLALAKETDADRRKDAAAAARDGGAQDLDEERVDAQEAHRRRLGRWYRETIEAIGDPLLWILIDIMSRTTQCWTHLLHWSQQVRTTQTTNEEGTHLVALTLYKAEEMEEAIDDLLDNDAFWVKVEFGCSALPEISAELFHFALLAVLHNLVAVPRIGAMDVT